MKNKKPEKQRKLSQAEILKSRGEKGLSPQEWVQQRKEKRGGLSRRELQEIWAKWEEVAKSLEG